MMSAYFTMMSGSHKNAMKTRSDFVHNNNFNNDNDGIHLRMRLIDFSS